MFHKILVANRGEIAVRIIRTCREMGIDTVAVFSTADRDSLHAQFATEAYCIGGPASKDSYLNMQAIMTVALETGCEAIHPGYGMLAENPYFADMVNQVGLKFIGPSGDTIRALGDKSNARLLMSEANVSVPPGSNGVLQDETQALAVAEQIGYPVLLKASAGGGGRGMRLVERSEDMVRLYYEAMLEAETAFGDNSLYIEKLIENPKHIEFQVLVDQAGNAIHLGDRDCSWQRRRQKVIEETPCPILSDEQRKSMGEAAIRAIKAVNYEGAGTVEFVLAEDGNFYFIEINTRIQVEHPITEMVTGIDIVREQIRIAQGGNLLLTQADVKINGHAFECRINAEKPSDNFRASPGVIDDFIMPGGRSVRIDSAIYPGCKISHHYDSMIVKVIVHGNRRSDAIRRMRRSLEETIINGIDTNIGLLYVSLFDQDMIRGSYNTSTLESHMDEILKYEKIFRISENQDFEIITGN
ncbi:MAG TPA: acetyl-CoA carboxylase biotin carboxylase subunit [Clostridiaceae bacterium]|nr:acetyl-CoA carboxylase biotin carboxylase subunit [Clostridiaceae bacterium]